MDTFFIESRDPLFGIIIFFLLLFLLSFISYVGGRRKSVLQHKAMERFLGTFAQPSSEVTMVSQIHNNATTNETWLALAQGFEHQGNFEKSIDIYHGLLTKTKDTLVQKEVLLKLGRSYFKAGFLERARQSFLQVLQHYPRTPYALKHLILIYEQLQQYDQALQVVESLVEIEGETALREQLYLQTRHLLANPKRSIEEKSTFLLTLYTQHAQLGYVVFEYLFTYAPTLAWSHFDHALAPRLADILWRLPAERLDLDIIALNGFLRELFSAKGSCNLVHSSSVFELDVLIALQHARTTKATLQFEYVCTECHQISFLPFHRCPTCHAIDSIEPLMSLTKERYEENNSFQ